MKQKIKESDLFIYLRYYFEFNPRNKIFTEVVGLEGGRPDIVIRTDKKITTIVEMKTSLSMALLEQVFNWRYKANYIYIAIPEPKNNRINSFVAKILKDYGIGLFFIKMPTDSDLKYLKKHEYRYCVIEKIKSKFFRNKKNAINWNEKLKDIYLCENNIEGGSTAKGYNTPYNVLIDSVRCYIKYRKRNRFTPFKELIEEIPNIKQHYYNPKAGLYNALNNIEFDNFEKRKIGKDICYRLTKESFNNTKRKFS